LLSVRLHGNVFRTELVSKNPPPWKRVSYRAGLQESTSMETCFVPSWSPRIHLHGNVFRTGLVSKNPPPWKRVSYPAGLQGSTYMETCFVPGWSPRIHLHGNVFVNAFLSNESTCHNIKDAIIDLVTRKIKNTS
jgi:hypothetical protein